MTVLFPFPPTSPSLGLHTPVPRFPSPKRPLHPTEILVTPMNLHHPTADVFIPDGTALDTALARITHLGIGAHQDDLEFMAFHGIEACYHSDTDWFGGVTCTNGSGSARTGAYG